MGSREERREKRDRKKFELWKFIYNIPLWQKILFAAILVILLAILIIGISGARYVENVVETVTEETPENYDLSITAVDGYINVLLLGVDTRDMSTIKGNRSDMMIIASINEETNEVKLTSIYRDTILKMGDTNTYDKITHACAYGGPEMTIKSINQALDIDIEYYGLVNFKAVADLVDAVGGIYVDVQQNEIYQLNKYTKATAKNIGKKDYKLVEKAGPQNLEGVQAVSYGRIRKGVGDDFKRTERMRIVIQKVFDKIKVMKFSEFKSIVNTLLPQVKTNMPLNDILALGIRMPQYSISTGEGWPSNWACGMINNISYVYSQNTAAAVTEFHKNVFGEENYVPSQMVRTISDHVAAMVANAKEASEEDQEAADELTGGLELDENGNVISGSITPTDFASETDAADVTDTGTGTEQVTQDGTGAGETIPEDQTTVTQETETQETNPEQQDPGTEQNAEITDPTLDPNADQGTWE